MPRRPTSWLLLIFLPPAVGGIGCARAPEARVDLLAGAGRAEWLDPLAEPASPPVETPTLQNGRVAVDPGRTLVYHLRVPGNARLRVGSAADGAGATLSVSLHDDERSEVLIERPLAPGRQAIDVAPLDSWRDRLARLQVANAGGGRAWIERLEILSPAPRASARRPAPAFAFRPNFVLYLVDTLRADRLGAYGHRGPTSPRFDAFAREAILFEDVWAQASWTRPTTASILTGLHPAVHGADRADRRLSDDAVTLAEALKRAGYRTGAFVANRLVGGRTGLDQGFDEWNGGGGSLYNAPASELGARALAWIDRGGSPFFLYVHAMDPHAPYAPPPQDAAPFEGPYAGERDTMALLRRGHRTPLHPRAKRFLESQYLGEIRRNDRAFGELLDGLRERRLLETSAVVFTADHGEEFWDHGSTQHGSTLYTEQLRVPLAVRLPGARRGGTRERGAVQQLDLYPTLLSLADVGSPADLPGRDLSGSWLRGDDAAPPPLLFSQQRFTVVDKAAVRAGSLKLIVNRDEPLHWRADARVELYDLARDPGEQVNLASARPIAVRCLLDELDRFDTLASARRVGPDATLTLSAEDRHQLRALGYLQ
jgi:arylsulfatase A-like enzyme